MVQKQGQSEWRVDRLAPGGEGFLKLADGRAAFVPGALPGDLIRPVHVAEHRGYLRALQWELLEPGRARIEPPCPHARQCGGCDWMALERAAQLKAKADIVRQALERTGGFRQLGEIPVVAAGEELGYRLRLRLHIDEGGSVGLLARASHRLVPIDRCAVSSAAVNAALPRLRELLGHPGAAEFAEVELLATPGEERVLLQLSPRRRRGLAGRALVEALRDEFDVCVLGEPAAESLARRLPLPAGAHLVALPGVFTQVNWAVNQRLVQSVVEGARARGVRRFFELFCGAGNFTLPLLGAGLRGRAVERSSGAIDSARRAAKAQGLPEDTFLAADSRRELERQTLQGLSYDLLLLDPPRSGARELMPTIAAAHVPTVAYVACDPVTLARDLRALAALGYVLDAVEAFDMFPQTHHVETLAWMRRSDQSSRS